MKKVVLSLCFVWIIFGVSAQIIDISPVSPTTTSNITVVFDATQGNAELSGYSGNVYAHAGLITPDSQNGNDWKYVVGNWGTSDPQVLMQKIGDDLYSISYNIAEFHNFDANTVEVLQLAYVFRNADGSVIGKSENGSDIFYSINIGSSGEYLSHTISEDGLFIVTTEGELSIEPFTPSIIRLGFTPEFSNPNDTSYSVILQSQQASFTVEENDDFLLLTTEELELRIEKSPVRTLFYKGGNLITSEEMGFYNQTDRQGVRLSLEEDEQLSGTGSRAIPIDRNGYRLQNYGQAHYGYGNGVENLNISIPFITSSKGYGLFFDNHTAGIFDLGNTNADVLDFSSESGNMVYYFIEGNEYDDLLQSYTLLTGRQPLPPIWSLGYIQSRFGYENETHARQTVADMQAANFPLDVIILDLYWFGDPGTMGNLAWDYSKWQNPPKMINDFKDVGVKTVLITEPYFTQNSTNYNYISQNNWFGNTTSGYTYLLDNFWAGPASLIDFTNKETLDWMWNFYEARNEEGVAGWWCDLGEPENHPEDMVHKEGTAKEVHNLISLLWAQSLFDNYAETYPEERLFNLIRSGYAGMQRYSTFPWSGDIQKSWEGLQAQVPIMLGMSMSGVAYMGSDIGGFTGEFNAELFTRWIQQGTFSPVMRAHGVGTITEPVYLSEPYKSIVRNFIELRYKMLPYNYTLAWQNTTKGRPLALPMDYFDRGNPFLENINDQYLWGEQLLVAPIMEEGLSSRYVMFPDGNWIDFRNNKTYVGENISYVNAPLDELPVFVKGGSFLPLTNPLMSTEYYNTDTLLIWFYPDNNNPNTEFTVYIDDGLSANALESNNYELVHLIGQVGSETILIDIEKEGNGFPSAPAERELIFELKRVNKKPLAVLLDNLNMAIVDNFDDYQNTENSAYFELETNILMLHFLWDGAVSQIEITGTGVGVDEIFVENQKTFVLNNAIPNPFFTETTLKLDVTASENYFLTVNDIFGKVVFSKMIDLHQKGSSFIKWDGRGLSGNLMPNGTYIISIRNNLGEKDFQKVVIMRN